MKTKRPYTMRVRAEQAEQTRLRIVGAVLGLAMERPLAACTLPSVAERAQVSVQTVLRIFGSRDELFAEAIERTAADVLAERPADPDDPSASVAALVDHYELRGDGVLLLLGQEAWEPVAAAAVGRGKAEHRRWVATVFAPHLEPLDGARRDQVLDLLVAATDVSAWKLWRRDAGRTRDETLERMLALVAAVTRHLA
ncbi:TetR/AcrR family transcriptional regulator [Agromyces aurantiacus]|uniref:TetR/AcrR family transcriptional regulator n=1 Tax=Agromyces aurantiacus TaxID=165814 RepID=A0ABV9R8S1_9MICO|nr:TetR/AcrR family transcriptional regulator [Agromyces aurantiacus]MBM7504352.1 AcrR family transcriptional regulator [Agromyces aurantiacus]